MTSLNPIAREIHHEHFLVECMSNLVLEICLMRFNSTVMNLI